MAWFGIVCTDVSRCSDVEFESFENVQVATSDRQQSNPLQRIAVAPFVVDLNMAERWAHAFRLATDRDVIGPAEMTSRLSPSVITQFTESITVQDDTELAKQVCRDMNIDGVFFGRAAGDRKEKVFWGMKDRYEKRLYLYLISSEGTLLWRAELPFAVIKGSKDIDEELTKQVLLTHVTAHEKELRWSALCSLYNTDPMNPPAGIARTGQRDCCRTRSL